jgi:hypothetical protein
MLLETETFHFLLGDEDDPDKPVPDVMRLPKEGKLLSHNVLIALCSTFNSVLRLDI